MAPDRIEAFRLFLEYGPLGLAGLMLLLVVVALTLKEMTPTHAGLLKFFMVVGLTCFVVAVAAEFFQVDGEHNLNLTVNPNDLHASSFPPPIILIDGKRVSEERRFPIVADTTVLVDVSNALGVFERVSTQFQQVSTQFEQVVARAEEQASTLAKVSDEISRIKNAPATTVNERQLDLLQRQIDNAIRPIE